MGQPLTGPALTLKLLEMSRILRVDDEIVIVSIHYSYGARNAPLVHESVCAILGVGLTKGVVYLHEWMLDFIVTDWIYHERYSIVDRCTGQRLPTKRAIFRISARRET
jgi:hypothetical protein